MLTAKQPMLTARKQGVKLSLRTGMLAKLTSKNQITLPKAAVARVEAAEYFEVSVDEGRIVLTPVRLLAAQAVRHKLQQLGLGEEDVAAAVAWARR